MFENKIKVKKFDILSFIIIILAFCLDRFSKTYVISLIEKNQSELFINDYLNITLNWNRGIAFGLLSFNATTIYHLISILILTIIIYLIYLMVKSDSLGKILFALIIGGAAEICLIDLLILQLLTLLIFILSLITGSHSI